MERIINLIKQLRMSIEIINDNPNFYSISFFKDNFEYTIDKNYNEYLLMTPYGQTFSGSENYMISKINELSK